MEALLSSHPPRLVVMAAALACCLCPAPGYGGEIPDERPAAVAPVFDSDLAARVGADERGMRSYVLVVLKTGAVRMPDGKGRTAMFAGHFANIQRLSDEGKLVLAGPFPANRDGWRGLFLLAVDDVDEARRLTETDPVIVKGEMVAEYHPWYGSAAAMMLPEIHARLVPEEP